MAKRRLRDRIRGLQRPRRSPLTVLAHAARHWIKDGADQMAAGIAYYGLLSFFPFLLLLGHVALGFLGRDPQPLHGLLGSVRAFVPTFDDTAWTQLQDAVEAHQAWSLASLLVLVFLSSRVVHSAQHAVCHIFDPQRRVPRETFMHALLSIVLTAGAMLVLVALFLSTSIIEVLAHAENTPPWLVEALEHLGLTRHVVPTLAMFLVGYVAFRHAPVHRPTNWHASLGAAVFALGGHAAVLIQARGVGALLENDLVYGSFVGVVTFLAWTWLVAALLLYGAELVAVLEGLRD